MGGAAAINMSGTNRVDLDVNGGDAVVKLAGNAKWIGEFNAGAAGSATRGGSIVVDVPQVPRFPMTVPRWYILETCKLASM